MADSAQVRSDIQIFLQRRSSKRVKNLLFEAMPTLEYVFAMNGSGKKGADGLGRPDAGVLMGRINEASRPRRERLFAEREYLPIIQISKPAKSEVKNMQDYDSNPIVPDWDGTNAPMKRFKQPRFKFTRKKMPYKIPHSERRTAVTAASTEGQAAAAVGSVYDVEVKTRTGVLCEVLNDELFGINSQQGYPTDEDAVQWDHLHSFTSALKADNTYGGVDRSQAANAFWRGNYLTDPYAGSFDDMIEYLNYDVGLIDKGMGVKIIGVGKNLIKRAKAEAKAGSYTLMSNGIPEYPEFGFKTDVVRIHSGDKATYVYYDPAIKKLDTETGTNHAICLDPTTWTFAIHEDSNFKVSKPFDQTENEGGDEADTGTIAVELMLCCEVPAANAMFTDVR